MLKTVIQQMKLRTEAAFRESASFVAVFAHDDGHAQTPSQEQGLVTKFLSGASRIHEGYTACPAAVAAGKYVELHTARRQQLSQHQDERSFSRAPDRQVADTDHRSQELLRANCTAVVERIAAAHTCTEDGRQEIHSLSRHYLYFKESFSHNHLPTVFPTPACFCLLPPFVRAVFPPPVDPVPHVRPG